MGKLVRVLIIDDNQAFLNAAVNFLQRQPEVEVVGAYTLVEPALRRVEEHSPDLILLDLDMPVMNGLEAIPLFKAVLPAVPIIVLSVLDSTSDEQAAGQAGADRFISKQTMHQELAAAIRRLSGELAV